MSQFTTITDSDRKGILAGKYHDVSAYKLKIKDWIFVKPFQDTIQAVQIKKIELTLEELGKGSGNNYLEYKVTFINDCDESGLGTIRYLQHELVPKIDDEFIKYVQKKKQ